MRLTRNARVVVCLFCLIHFALGNAYETSSHFAGDEISFPRIGYRELANSTSNSTSPDDGQPSIIPRCRAQELSPGGAAWILLVLGTACVVQLPGSVTLPFHQGLYRLAPEMGFLEACAVVALVARGVFTYKQKFKTSVKAVFALRRALGEGDRWWMDEIHKDMYEYSLRALAEERQVLPFLVREELRSVKISKRCTPTEAYYKLEPFLSSVRHFSPALVKACVVTGTIRTTALAGCYALSFFPIEILTWTLLEFRPRPSKSESEAEAHEIAKLMSILNPYRKRKFLKRSTMSLILPEVSSGWWFWGFTCIELLVEGTMIFWPLSIIISMFEIMTWQKGQWIFWCFALALWLIAIAGVVATIYIVSFIVGAIARRRGQAVKWTTKQLVGLSPASVYVGFKMFVILREYLIRYTGEGTRKPDWLDWLN